MVDTRLVFKVGAVDQCPKRINSPRCGCHSNSPPCGCHSNSPGCGCHSNSPQCGCQRAEFLQRGHQPGNSPGLRGQRAALLSVTWSAAQERKGSPAPVSWCPFSFDPSDAWGRPCIGPKARKADVAATAPSLTCSHLPGPSVPLTPSGSNLSPWDTPGRLTPG